MFVFADFGVISKIGTFHFPYRLVVRTLEKELQKGDCISDSYFPTRELDPFAVSSKLRLCITEITEIESVAAVRVYQDKFIVSLDNKRVGPHFWPKKVWEDVKAVINRNFCLDVR